MILQHFCRFGVLECVRNYFHVLAPLKKNPIAGHHGSSSELRFLRLYRRKYWMADIALTFARRAGI